jgi:hypothetical protein
MRRCAADHALGFGANGDWSTVSNVDRDNRRLVEDDPFASDVDKRVRRAEINRHVSPNDVGQRVT